MANTRSQDNNRIDNLLQEQEQQILELRENLACQDKRYDELREYIRMMFLNFVVHQNAAQGQGPEVQCSKAALRGPPVNGGSYFHASCVGKMKFPKFSGDDVEGWIYRCQQFFEFDSTLEELGSS